MRAVTIAIIIVVIDAVGAVGAVGGGGAAAPCDIAVAVRLEIKSNGNAILGLNDFFFLRCNGHERKRARMLIIVNYKSQYAIQ